MCDPHAQDNSEKSVNWNRPQLVICIFKKKKERKKCCSEQMKSVATVDQLVTNLQRVFQPFQYKNPSSKAALGQLIPSFSSSKFSTNLTTCSYSLVKYIHLQYTTEFLSTLKTNTRLPHGTDIGRHHLALPSGLNDLLPSVETCSLSKVASHPGAACMPDQTPIAGQSLHPVPTQESSEILPQAQHFLCVRK